MPARWAGYTAAASTINMRALTPPSMLTEYRLWHRKSKIWLFNMGMPAALFLCVCQFCAAENLAGSAANGPLEAAESL